MNNRKLLIILIIIVILLICIISGSTIYYILFNNKEIKNEIKTEEDNNVISIDFDYKFLGLENYNENIIYSPLSIKYALNMLNEGANGNTKDEIDLLIKDTNLKTYENIKDILNLANSIYIRDTYKNNIKQEYIDTLKNKYNAIVNYDSFENVFNINKWISDNTFNQINEMLDSSVLPNLDIKMMLINALAIDMEWNNKFEERDTKGGTFYNDEEIIATTMYKKDKSDDISYYKSDDVTLLQMNLKKYDDIELEFITIMPKEIDKYINNFNTDKLNDLYNKLTKTNETKNGVNIYIPRFSINYKLNLSSDLYKLGIKDAFNPTFADFSKINEQKTLYVSDILHKSNIDLSEKGIKAAASTVVIMSDNALMKEEDIVDVVIDKPFIFIIRDKNTKDIWFVGKVVKPNLWEEDKDKYKYE